MLVTSSLCKDQLCFVLRVCKVGSLVPVILESILQKLLECMCRHQRDTFQNNCDAWEPVEG